MPPWICADEEDRKEGKRIYQDYFTSIILWVYVYVIFYVCVCSKINETKRHKKWVEYYQLC